MFAMSCLTIVWEDILLVQAKNTSCDRISLENTPYQALGEN